MALTLEQMQARQNQTIEGIRSLNNRNNELVEIENRINAERAERVHAYQLALSTAIDEAVFSAEFFENRGYKRAKGRASVKAENVENKSNIDPGHVANYLHETLSRLEALRREVEKFDNSSNQALAEQDNVKNKLAEVVYAAIDDKVFSKNQLIAMGYTIPPRPAKKEKVKEEKEEQNN